MSEQRKPGWYWIKAFVDMEWECAEWDGKSWFLAGLGMGRDQVHLVGKRIPTPDEGWQCVPTEATPDMLDVLTLGNKVTAGRRWRYTLAVAPSP